MDSVSGSGSGGKVGRPPDAGRRIDFGPAPAVVNIGQAARQNSNFRRSLWTGPHLQMTLMSIPPGGDIGVERHPQLDQIIRVEEGQGQVMMGRNREKWELQRPVGPGFAVFIPAGTWHNLINTQRRPLKLSSVYAPPQHPWGAVHRTREEATEHEY